MQPFQALGKSGSKPSKNLETFPTPDGITVITFRCDEVTSFCPVTHQPDFATVEIIYWPGEKCIETKSLKLYLQTFRDEAIFCEDLAAQIARDMGAATDAHHLIVTVKQHKRGGIETEATAEWRLA